MSSPDRVDDEKLAHDAIQPIAYAQLSSPSVVQPSHGAAFSYQTLSTPAHHTDERKEAASDADKPSTSATVAPTPADALSAPASAEQPSSLSGFLAVPIAKQHSSFTQPAAVPQPCPGEQYFGTWRHPSLLYFGWLTPLIRLGARRPLQFDDLWQTFDAEKADAIWGRFLPAWQRESQKAAVEQRKAKLRNVFVRIYGWQFLWSMLIWGYTIADTLLGPQFLNWLVTYSITAMRDPDTPAIDGYKFCLLMFGSAVLAAFCRSYTLHTTTRIFLRMRNVLILAIYKKSLRIGSRDRDDGKVNNLMSSDTQKLVEFSQQVHNLWSAPIIIAIGVWELYRQVGWASIIGLVVMIVFLPIAGLMTAKQITYQRAAAAGTDRRITIINEFVQGIRVVKYYAWERPFLGVLDEARDQELVWLRKYNVLKSMTFGILMLVPLIVSVVIFGIYAGLGGDMTPSVVFTAISLINVIRMPFTFLPLGLMGLTQTLVAFGRIEDFLATPELDEDQVEKLDHVGVVLEQAELSWGQAAEERGLKAAGGKAGKAAVQADDAKEKEREVEVTETTVAVGTVAAAGTSGSQAPPTGAIATLADKSAATVNADNTVATAQDIAKDAKDTKDAKDKEKPTKGPVPPILTNVSFTVNKGELVLVIGPVGSGKSSLLCGLLGEAEKTKGRLAFGGRIGYVPQSAFIINATLRQNVLFGQPYDAVRYKQCLTACALDSDIALLPNGDMTEIGERGINISGGQKQRISIARAAYALDSDIILLDDPLSAVDAHVSKHIFEHCINGMMRGKTRLLITHSMAFVDEADQILMLKQTAVKDSYTVKAGTAESLRADDADFRSLLATYNKGKDAIAGDGKDGKKKKADAGGKKIADVTKPADPSSTEKKVKGKLLEVEEREEGQIGWDVYKRYVSAGGNLLFYIVAPIAFCATQSIQTGSDFWLARWSNHLSDNTFTTGFWLGIYGLLVGGSTMFMVMRTTSMSLFGIRSSRRLHHDLARSILGKTIAWFDRTPAGRIINRFTKDLYVIDLMLSMMLEFSVATSLSVVGIFIVIAIIIPISLAIFVPLMVIYLICTHYYRRSNTELQRLESISRTPVFVHFAETLGGSITIRALKVQQMYIDENTRRVDENARAFYYSRAVNFWLRVRLDLIGAVVLGASATLAVGSGHLHQSAITAGDFGLLISYALNVTQLLNISVILTSQVEAFMNSVERVQHYSVPRDQEKWEAADEKLSKSVQGGHWPPKGHIQVKNLQMRYREDLDMVLNNINLDIPAGARVGVVGRTGSGKSSLLVALFRMVEPCGGEIVVDGVPLGQLSLEDVRTHLSILPQEATLFYGSLKYNIDPFAQHSDDEVWAALRYVQLEGVVRRMPKQLNTLVAEAGSNLSAGQRQLLCLARALLRKPKVLCLDEATANVDIETDELIQRVIRQQFSNCTIITIAHRLNTVLDYDLLIVLEKGRVAEVGTPDELRGKENGIFAGMLQGVRQNDEEDV